MRKLCIIIFCLLAMNELMAQCYNDSFLAQYRKKEQGKLSGISANTLKVKPECNLRPNPSSGQDVTIILTSSKVTTANISIIDATGKSIRNLSNLAVAEGNNYYSLNTESLAAGIYYVQVSLNDKTSYTLKLVVVK